MHPRADGRPRPCSTPPASPPLPASWPPTCANAPAERGPPWTRAVRPGSSPTPGSTTPTGASAPARSGSSRPSSTASPGATPRSRPTATGPHGAGAADRAAPVGLSPLPLNPLVRLARDSAHVTHAHPLTLEGAAVQACAVAYAHCADPRRPLAAFHPLSTAARYCASPEFRSQPTRPSALVRGRFTRKDTVRVLVRGGRRGRSRAPGTHRLPALPRRPARDRALRRAAGQRQGPGGGHGRSTGRARNGAGAVPEAWSRRLENAPRDGCGLRPGRMHGGTDPGRGSGRGRATEGGR
ncbi:ADP-ribosylglycohydrolase family protein [Nocardiopsis sp. CC223A]|uniref:ADP-ribosylglycohydrolase family protein n=1 Tax=Nocardiopsis sp. CC223A TaxID=3044051 RepID=UPI003558CD7E